jgi:hypothetical protein
MFLKREVRRKDGKEHVYYYLAESTRVGRDRVVQRRLLNLGELNTTKIDRWQRSIEVIEEDGRACQRRLFSDREGQAPQQQEDVCEVVLASLSVRRPRSLGDCWLGCRLWEELGLDKFWFEALGDRRGAVEWSKVIELLVMPYSMTARSSCDGPHMTLRKRSGNCASSRCLLIRPKGSPRSSELVLTRT